MKINDSLIVRYSEWILFLSYSKKMSTFFRSPPSHSSRTIVQSPGTKKKKGKNNKDDAGSSDEERWLKAIETGKLDEVDDELKKIKKKDPKMMTARQRAMFDRKTDSHKEFAEELVALPSGIKLWLFRLTLTPIRIVTVRVT